MEERDLSLLIGTEEMPLVPLRYSDTVYSGASQVVEKAATRPRSKEACAPWVSPPSRRGRHQLRGGARRHDGKQGGAINDPSSLEEDLPFCTLEARKAPKLSRGQPSPPESTRVYFPVARTSAEGLAVVPPRSRTVSLRRSSKKRSSFRTAHLHILSALHDQSHTHPSRGPDATNGTVGVRVEDSPQPSCQKACEPKRSWGLFSATMA
jgi:hypothetical protein